MQLAMIGGGKKDANMARWLRQAGHDVVVTDAERPPRRIRRECRP